MSCSASVQAHHSRTELDIIWICGSVDLVGLREAEIYASLSAPADTSLCILCKDPQVYEFYRQKLARQPSRSVSIRRAFDQNAFAIEILRCLGSAGAPFVYLLTKPFLLEPLPIELMVKEMRTAEADVISVDIMMSDGAAFWFPASALCTRAVGHAGVVDIEALFLRRELAEAVITPAIGLLPPRSEWFRLITHLMAEHRPRHRYMPLLLGARIETDKDEAQQEQSALLAGLVDLVLASLQKELHDGQPGHASGTVAWFLYCLWLVRLLPQGTRKYYESICIERIRAMPRIDALLASGAQEVFLILANLLGLRLVSDLATPQEQGALLARTRLMSSDLGSLCSGFWTAVSSVLRGRVPDHRDQSGSEVLPFKDLLDQRDALRQVRSFEDQAFHWRSRYAKQLRLFDEQRDRNRRLSARNAELCLKLDRLRRRSSDVE